jgi:hypothetical protein
MVHPRDYYPNEAWIFFKLSHVPVSTELEGEFDVFALMDAASLYILGTEFVPAGSLADANAQIRSLLNTAHSQASAWPEKLLVSEATSGENLVSEAGASGVSVETVSQAELSKFTNEARQGFKAHFGGGELH